MSPRKAGHYSNGQAIARLVWCIICLLCTGRAGSSKAIRANRGWAAAWDVVPAYSRRPAKKRPRRTIAASQGYQKCQNKGRFVNNNAGNLTCLTSCLVQACRTTCRRLSTNHVRVTCYLGILPPLLLKARPELWPEAEKVGPSPHPAFSQEWQRQSSVRTAMATGIQGARNRRCPFAQSRIL